MIQWPTHLIVREWVLLPSGLIMLFLVITLLAYLRRANLAHPKTSVERDAVRAEAAMLMLDAGIMIRALWVWALLFSETHNHIFGNIEAWWAIDILAGILTVAGGAWKLYELAPYGYGRRLTIFSVAVSFAITIAVHLAI